MANRGCHTDLIPNGYVYTASCINYSAYDTVYCRYHCYYGYEPTSSYVTCVGSNQWISSATHTNVPCIVSRRPWTTVSPNYTEPTYPPFNWGNFTPFPERTTSNQPYIGNSDDPDLKMNVTTEVFLSALVVGLLAIAAVAAIIFYRAHKRNMKRLTTSSSVGCGNCDYTTPTAPSSVQIQLPPLYDQITATSPSASDRDGIPVTAPSYSDNANRLYDTTLNSSELSATPRGLTDITNAIDKSAVDHDLPPPYAEFADLDPPTAERNTDVNEYDPFDGYVNDSAGFHGNEYDELEFVFSARQCDELLTDEPPPYSMV
ncbi:uncharacterized protein LOC127867611 [Dreissena polymorpha]|uniref:Sushi domain-containing protein n=1 Tax=Dreissena polymorpha TaxID=45954 RepID=A0A9D4M1K9_DREPO|nr:uncharacterized protein LOC127867611 [Dreissena polymorpha]KAH3867753.1 hypothetical protein DPMN_030888 [Dreissena polymorpha]